jgi:hypothetical protein
VLTSGKVAPVHDDPHDNSVGGPLTKKEKLAKLDSQRITKNVSNDQKVRRAKRQELCVCLSLASVRV